MTSEMLTGRACRASFPRTKFLRYAGLPLLSHSGREQPRPARRGNLKNLEWGDSFVAVQRSARTAASASGNTDSQISAPKLRECRIHLTVLNIVPLYRCTGRSRMRYAIS